MKKLTASITATLLSAAFATSAFASDIKEIHFIVPGGAGGGWDMETARHYG